MRRATRLRAMVAFAGQQEEIAGPPTADMIGWWKADAISGVADGNPVTLWGDSSGTGNDLDSTAGFGPVYPTYVASDPLLAGKPSVAFNGSQWLTKSAAPVGMPTGNTAMSVYTVAYYTSSGGKIIWYWGTTLGAWPGYSVGFSSHPFSPHSLLINNNARHWGSLANPVGTPFAAAWSHDAGEDVIDSPLYLNGSTGPTTYPASPGPIDMTPAPNWTISFGLYSSSPGGADFVGNIAEVIVYKAAHDLPTLLSVSSYLQSKYGIA